MENLYNLRKLKLWMNLRDNINNKIFKYMQIGLQNKIKLETLDITMINVDNLTTYESCSIEEILK